jgi:hypothetical protein
MKPRLLGLLVSAVIGAAIAASPVRASNLIVDGSFEDSRRRKRL